MKKIISIYCIVIYFILPVVYIDHLPSPASSVNTWLNVHIYIFRFFLSDSCVITAHTLFIHSFTYVPLSRI